MAWKFGAPLTTMYTPKIEANQGAKHRGARGWYLDICAQMHNPMQAKTSFHKECVAKQAIHDVGGASIEIFSYDDLEQVEQITLQVASIMAQAIPTSMVGLKGHKGKGQK